MAIAALDVAPWVEDRRRRTPSSRGSAAKTLGRAAIALLEDALALQDAGVFAILLELVPARVAEVITQKLEVPTISIGSGAGCSGQCQILHDAIGMFDAFVPRHAKRYTEVGAAIRGAMEQFVADIHSKAYPGPEHAFKIGSEALRAFLEYAKAR